ncbi:hypothetical protein MRS44_012674 [Fusarium solani]|uniref:uncharacterized protein n=1 Tax=Fusarium solani TaxID=169388 RepID=UPI0032C41225|nr:hypothetical protein MRS44_012674 [Fusarium solani]
MSKLAVATEAVKETLVGTHEPEQLSAHSKARFIKHAVKDAESGDLFLGPDEFINAVAPKGEDFHKISRDQYSILFSVADAKGAGKVSLADWGVFENLLNKPDAEYQIAFRLFDVERTGSVKYDDFRTLYELNKGPENIAFDWDSDWAKIYIGSKKHRHPLDYQQFSQMLRGLQGERVRQAFHQLDKDGDGFINGEEFERIIRETARHKLSDHILDNLHTLCNLSIGAKISYANSSSCAEPSTRAATARSPAPSFSTRLPSSPASLFTPMEADILFHFAGLDEPSGRLGLSDFAKVLDPSWRNPIYDAVEATKAKLASGSILFGVLSSAYSFALGSVAGAFGAFMVYPIDLVKTRLQNQRSAQPGQRLYKNSIDCFQKLVGVAPEKAIKLTVNDLARKMLTDKNGHIPLWAEMVAGGSAGGCQVFRKVFTNPLEIVKIRLQVQGEVAKTVEGTPKRSAMWIVRNLGLVGLYKGASACLLRDVPFSAIYFPTYSHLKKDFFGESPTNKLGVMQLLTAGAIAGMPAAYLTTPCDVIKTRLQVEARKGEATYNGLRHAAKTIWKEEGFTAFFKGGPARIFRSSPQFGFTLAAYEFLHTMLPMPGTQPEKIPTGLEAVSKGSLDTSPYGRSRNALKVILDLDEDFGKVKLPNEKGWRSLPKIMGGGGAQ